MCPRNLFKQNKNHKEKEEILVMKITGTLVDMLLKLDPGNFKGCVVYERIKKVIYVVILRELYLVLVASLIW